MPRKQTVQRARKDKMQGKAPTTQAGEFVREEMHHIREGRHGARSPQQAIAIGLSKARRAGVPLRPPKSGSPELQRKAARDQERGKTSPARKPSRARSRAVRGALKREGSSAASAPSLARQAHGAAMRRGPVSRSAAAKKAARTKGAAGRSAAAKKAARTRARG